MKHYWKHYRCTALALAVALVGAFALVPASPAEAHHEPDHNPPGHTKHQAPDDGEFTRIGVEDLTGSRSIPLTGTVGAVGALQSAAAQEERLLVLQQPAPPTGTFVGQLLNPVSSVVDGQLRLAGQLVGEVRSPSGQVLAQVNQQVPQVLATLLDPGAVACDILHLELAPIDLNLLGLHLTTNLIIVDLDAEPGPGALLGNLLCGVSYLLDDGLGLGDLLGGATTQASLNAVVAAVNQLLRPPA
jgi:hypothetical protein